MNQNYFYVKKVRIWKLIMLFIVGISCTFLFASVLVTSLKQAKSVYLHDWLNELSMNGYMYALGTENHYFVQEYRQYNKEFSVSTLLLSAVTNIRFHDVRSLLGTELPGFAKYDTDILIAGEGTNYSNLPNESSVPLEELLQNRNGEGTSPSPPKTDVPKKSPAHSTNGKKVVFIYHTHSWESYLPLLHLPVTSPDSKATSTVTNISIFGDRFREQLENNGIGASDDKTDIGQMLIAKGLNSNSSYKMSRQVMQTAMTTNKDYTYFFDLHRDSSRRDVTTKQLNGQSYARLYFVIGSGNQNYTKNEQFAKTLHEMIEKKYPGLSRGVARKNSSMGNGVYNQDLSGQAILVEVGGVDNTVEELNRTIDVLAETFSDYYWQAEKVNGSP
ncbi:stage II sporulation protein P [Ectobacillus sp. sgz5001026]|uniref:stage II sporulation protein P n=1 Tax=Ectobacillus sp. sgz5001026 TaxID=3242473 RepID=UPI0036D24176